MDGHQSAIDAHDVVVVSIKAFGDLVIAYSCCERAHRDHGRRVTMLISEHLVPLYEALETSIPYRVVRHRDGGMPALFEMRKAGLIAAAKSAISLRRGISNAGLPQGGKLLFDRRGIRESYITQGWPFETISSNANIYLAYDAWFGTRDVAPSATRLRRGPLRVFPGSRMPAKNLPLPLIIDLSQFARSLGFSVELMLLDGERPDLEASALDHVIIPRNFGAMIDAVRGAALVVSADSMPAHIAEAADRPAFVFSPVPNRYWLPRTTYLQGWDALFEDGGQASGFADFLHRAS